MIAEAMVHDTAQEREFFARKAAFTTGPVEVSHQIKDAEDVAIIDVRAAEDYEKGHGPGAVNLPEERWNTLEGLRKDTINILYCYSQTCHLAAKAALQFAEQGYPVMEMDGGFEAWKKNARSREVGVQTGAKEREPWQRRHPPAEASRGKISRAAHTASTNREAGSPVASWTIGWKQRHNLWPVGGTRPRSKPPAERKGETDGKVCHMRK